MDDINLTEEDIKKLFEPEKMESSPKVPVTSSESSFRTLPSPFHRVPYTPPKPKPKILAPATVETPAKTKYHSKSRRLARSLVIFFASFVLSFCLVNGATFISRVGYWWRHDVVGQNTVRLTELPTISPGSTPATPPSAPSLSPSPPSSLAAPSRTNRLSIPKIGVNAPIIWNADPNQILRDLQRGVAHYQGTSLPNTVSGNVFITGHSSGYPWDPGQYKTVFANLDKLVAGDTISVTTEQNTYVYRVKDSVVVRPSETSVLAPTPTPILSLMTCVPVGTNLRRLIVRADLIEVKPL